MKGKHHANVWDRIMGHVWLCPRHYDHEYGEEDRTRTETTTPRPLFESDRRTHYSSGLKNRLSDPPKLDEYISGNKSAIYRLLERGVLWGVIGASGWVERGCIVLAVIPRFECDINLTFRA
jgi:hypothetical protein